MPPNGKTYKISLGYFKARGFIDLNFRNPISNRCIYEIKDVEITNNNGKMEVYYNMHDSNSTETYCNGTRTFVRDAVIKSDDVLEFNVGDTFTAPDFTVFEANGTIGNKSNVSVSYIDSNGNTVSQIDMTRPGKWYVSYSYYHYTSGMFFLYMRRNVEVIVK